MSILEPSRKREAVVGVLLPVDVALAASPPQGPNPGPVAGAAAAALASGAYQGCLMLFPLDPRLPKCIVGPDSLATLPQELKCVAAGQLTGTPHVHPWGVSAHNIVCLMGLGWSDSRYC